EPDRAARGRHAPARRMPTSRGYTTLALSGHPSAAIAAALAPAPRQNRPDSDAERCRSRCHSSLMGYFKTMPKEVEEQAMIDGASRWRAMTWIILPLCLPGFLSAGIFAFTLSQNEFLYALLFLSKSSVRTVPIGVVGEL